MQGRTNAIKASSPTPPAPGMGWVKRHSNGQVSSTSSYSNFNYTLPSDYTTLLLVFKFANTTFDTNVASYQTFTKAQWNSIVNQNFPFLVRPGNTSGTLTHTANNLRAVSYSGAYRNIYVDMYTSDEDLADLFG